MYYFAIVEDFILRFFWAIGLVMSLVRPGVPAVLTVIAPPLEIFRSAAPPPPESGMGLCLSLPLPLPSSSLALSLSLSLSFYAPVWILQQFFLNH